MGNMVASRRLRKSTVRELGDFDVDIFGNRGLGKLDNIIEKNKTGVNNLNANDEKKSITYKFKLMIKVFICALIVFSCVLGKLAFINELKSNDMVTKAWTEYNTDYSKENVLEGLEQKSSFLTEKFSYLIPSKISNYVQTKYNTVKPYLLNFNLKNSVQEFFKGKPANSQVENVEDQNNNSDNNGIGGGEPIADSNEDSTQQTTETSYEENTSEVSTMQENVKQILDRNLSIIQPVQGTITCRYGVREQIFADADPYHTGIDIANKAGTEIHAACSGTVVNVEQNNKYYGKLIEIENNGVFFRYGHLNETKVSQGQQVNQSDVIGLMGSTGYSTGPHLHFEIRINNTSVDPEDILEIK